MRALFCFFATATTSAPTSARSAVATAEKLEAIDDHFVLAALAAAFLVVPGFVFQATFHQDWLALLAIFIDGLGHFSEGGAIDEEHLFTVLALRGPPLVIDGQAKIDHRRLAGQVAQLGIAREIACKDYFVEVSHSGHLSI